MKPITLTFEGRAYEVAPSMSLALEIEEELGALPELAARLESGVWRAGELAALFHIILQRAGRAVDFLKLGDRMVAEGLNAHARAARDILNLLLDGARA